MNKIYNKLKEKGMNEEAMYVLSLERINEELIKERDRYKSIISDIKNFGSLRPKTIEDIRDITC